MRRIIFLETLLVRILRYSRHWDHITLLKSLKPEGGTIASGFYRWIWTNGRVWQYSTRVSTISTDRNSGCPPRTAVPYLQAPPMVPNAEESRNCQKHSNHYPYRYPDYQPSRLAFHLLKCTLVPIQWSKPLKNLQNDQWPWKLWGQFWTICLICIAIKEVKIK